MAAGALPAAVIEIGEQLVLGVRAIGEPVQRASGQARMAFSSMSMEAPNCDQRIDLKKLSMGLLIP